MLKEIGNKERLRIEQYALSVAAISAGVADSLRYVHTLQVNPSELGRYFKKTTNLALCYAGFAQEFSLFQARQAGRAAFLSCAYDVVSDWHKAETLKVSYAGILNSETNPDLANLALDLLDRDLKGNLLDDGLERGVVAVECILQAMGIRQIFDRKCDIRNLGLNLQIVDDVLDYEDDISLGDQNCLTNPRLREDYLRRLPQDFNDLELHYLFPYGGILTYAIKLARQKAENMLAMPERYF